ncbi:MAG: hypothetical protein WCE38_18990 [Burkholderiales bacterium]
MHTLTDQAFEHARVQRDIRRICLTLVWLKGGSTPDRCKEVIAALRAHPDIESAERAPGKANVVMMRFDRSRTSASEIVLELRRSGVSAVLVGC